MSRHASLLVLAGCGSFELSPIELDVSTNCDEVDVVTIGSGIESTSRPWHTIVAAVVDRAGTASAWLFVVRAVPGGLDQLALVHVDDDLQVDQEVFIDLPVGLVDQLDLVAADEVGVVYLTQRAPGTFFIRRYDARQIPPFVASSPNLAAVSVPCDPDNDENPDACDASAWFQDLVFFGDDPVQAHALTFAPMSADASIDVTPTPLDFYLTPSFDEGRTIDVSPRCDGKLSVEDLEVCKTLIDSLSYPVLEAAGLARDVGSGIAILAIHREVQIRNEPTIVADMPLLLFGLSETESPSVLLRVGPDLPSPRNEPPRGVALDTAASYLFYTSTDGTPVLARAAHSSPTLERLDGDLEIPTGMELLQLDEDVALHRIVDGAWEILKLFPDAPRNSKLTVHAPEPGVEAVVAAGRSAFVVRTTDGDADLVQLRCAVATIP